MITAEHVGKHLLIKEELDHPFEVLVKEISPNGENVKLKFPSGISLWCAAGRYKVVDVLRKRKKKVRGKSRRKNANHKKIKGSRR